MIDRKKKVHDPLLNIISSWDQNVYTSTTWTIRAFTRMFEKFHYADPCDFVNEYPEIVILSDLYTVREHSYMSGTSIIPITSTIKNLKSTPAYPKYLFFDTEEDYLQSVGWEEYIKVWNDDNTINQRPLWWCFLKNEVLKREKVENDDIRMILCTDPVFTRIGACYEQEQNNRMKTMTEHKKAQVGWTPFFGGINKRILRLCKIEKPQFIEMDWTRFDGTLPKALFWRIKQMRYFFLANKTRKDKTRYDWYIKNLLEKIILLPTGEVCQVKKGNPSGQYSTTVDNNMCNVWLTCFEIIWLYNKQHSCLPSIGDIELNIDFICYGDDRLLAVSENFVKYEPNEVINMYRNVFGMWVKHENVKVSRNVEGLSFCGMKIVKSKKGYVGVPNVDKILSTLTDPVRRLPNIEALWGKLVSLRILCENCADDVKDYLEAQIERVEEYSRAEGIVLPEVGPDFYEKIW
nr:ORF1b [Mute swan feces associated avastrovius 2]